MQWLQDKKNLPIVIGLVAVLIIGSGAFLYMQMKGGSGSDTSVTPVGPGAPTGVPAPDAAPQLTGTPGGPLAPGGAPPGAPGPPMPGGAPVAAAPTAAAPGTPGAPGAAPAAGGQTVVAKITPREAWRDDPFLPLDYTPPKTVKGHVIVLRIPSVPRVFPPPRPVPHIPDILNPQPPRRVAGIIYSQRVSALLQTPDGWETVRPGDKLRDGTLVERIERDRVVLRTTDARPRLITVKLAAAAMGQPSEGGASAAPPTGVPGGPMFPGGPPGLPGGYRPPRNEM